MFGLRGISSACLNPQAVIYLSLTLYRPISLLPSLTSPIFYTETPTSLCSPSYLFLIVLLWSLYNSLYREKLKSLYINFCMHQCRLFSEHPAAINTWCDQTFSSSMQAGTYCTFQSMAKIHLSLIFSQFGPSTGGLSCYWIIYPFLSKKLYEVQGIIAGNFYK